MNKRCENVDACVKCPNASSLTSCKLTCGSKIEGNTIKSLFIEVFITYAIICGTVSNDLVLFSQKKNMPFLLIQN